MTHPLGLSLDGRRAWRVAEGRTLVYVPEHPRARKNGFMLRARFVAECLLGRLLEPDEIAHHINRIVDDDRPENIQPVKNTVEHNKLHGKPSLRARRRTTSRPYFIGDRCPTHPGEIFRLDYREPMDLSREDAARKLGITTRRLARLEDWRARMTMAEAISLGELTGVDAETWATLQMHHDLWKERHGARRMRQLRARAKRRLKELARPPQVTP
jgi:antitoxin HigA-1